MFLLLLFCVVLFFFFFSSRRRHTRLVSDWSSDVCSSDLRSAKLLHVWGQALDPMAAWLIDRGMKTLAVRVARQNETALARSEERRVGKECRSRWSPYH